MTWYTTGTISVTNGSPTVYGTGTLWVDTGTLNAGDITLIGSTLYQVQSIQSNTQLTLSSNFLGTTASGASYAIIPIGLLPSALAQQVKSTLASASTALASAVLNTAGQAMTTAQQLNARQNIAALGAADVGQGYISLSVAGNTNVALTATQGQASIINLTGVLTGNINVTTSMTPRLYIIENATTGAFSLTFIGTSGTGVTIPQGGSSLLFCDGTNIFSLMSFVGSMTELSGGLKTALNTLDDGGGNATFGSSVAGHSVVLNGIGSGTNGGAGFYVQNNANTVIAIGNYSSLIGGAYDATPTIYASLGLKTFINGSLRSFLDGNGNLGFAVTPSAWDSNGNIELQGSRSITFDSSYCYLNANAFHNSGVWKYVSADYATQYIQAAGVHAWNIAPSGGAGTTISFTQAMTLSNSGGLNLGGTFDPGAGNLNVTGLIASGLTSAGSGYLATKSAQLEGPYGRAMINHASGDPTGELYIGFGYNGSGIGSITQSGTTGVAYNTTSDPRLKNITGPITAAAAIAFVNGLKPLVGTWKSDGSPFCGFLTTDYAQIDPGSVVGQPDATEDIGDLKDAEGKVLQSGVPQPTTLENGQTWTKTGIQNVYQSMEYASPAWCANMTAALQGALATIAEMQSLLHAAGIKGF